MISPDYQIRFGGLSRIFGESALPLLANAHFCVIGVGGVGSWAAEACARSGIGKITLIDHDDIEASNTNRQVHTLSETLGQSKVMALHQRILSINPECNCIAVDDLVTAANLDKFVLSSFDYVIDAIDQATNKMALMHYCRRNKINFVSTGGAGGMTDPTRIEIADLTRSSQDPLLARVRSQLRWKHNYSRNPSRRFGMDCVFSTEQAVYPTADGGISHQKPKSSERTTLDCATGIGSFVAVTASFGLAASAHAIRKYLTQSARQPG